MLEYFVKDNSIFMIILIAMIIGLTCYIVSNIKELRNQRKNGKPLDCDVIVISVLAALLVTFALVSMGVGIADARKLNYAAKHDAIARHYNLKRDGNHLLLTLKDPDKDRDFKDNILLDLSSETKDSYHVIFHDDLYNIPKSDKKQTTRIENTKE